MLFSPLLCHHALSQLVSRSNIINGKGQSPGLGPHTALLATPHGQVIASARRGYDDDDSDDAVDDDEEASAAASYASGSGSGTEDDEEEEVKVRGEGSSSSTRQSQSKSRHDAVDGTGAGVGAVAGSGSKRKGKEPNPGGVEGNGGSSRAAAEVEDDEEDEGDEGEGEGEGDEPWLDEPERMRLLLGLASQWNEEESPRIECELGRLYILVVPLPPPEPVSTNSGVPQVRSPHVPNFLLVLNGSMDTPWNVFSELANSFKL